MRFITLTFTVLLVASLTLIGVTASPYDPWADYDADGDVDIYDVVPVATAYGTTGDSTRNVTVTNFPTEPEPKTIVVVQNYTATYVGENVINIAKADVSEYRYTSVFVAYYRPDTLSAYLWIIPSCLNITAEPGGSIAANIDLIGGGSYWKSNLWRGYSAGAPEVSFSLWIPDGSVELTIVIYCYN